MNEEQKVAVSIQQGADYQSHMRFDGTMRAPLATGEAAPLGHAAGRNPLHLLFAARMQVDLRLADKVGALQNPERALSRFETFCIAAESVYAVLPISVRVHAAKGALVRGCDAPAAGV